MAVLGHREVLPRTYEHKLGSSPTASRVFMVTVDEPTASSAVLAAIGIEHGASHPDHAGLMCDGISLDEPDRHHVTVTYNYVLPDPNDQNDNPDQPPWLQPDRWTFGTTNASVACETYYVGGGNGNKRALTNTAGDLIVGISKAESELKITISGSRLTLNLASIKRYVNTINNAPWAGFPTHTVQLVGVSASPDRIEWEGAVINFWQINFELVYRSSSHNIALPNVGWNVIVNGRKERAWVYITENGERAKVPSPHPVALNRAGGFLCGQGQDGGANMGGGTAVEDDGTDYYGGG